MGHIKPKSKDSVQYSITSVKDLMEVIIPHLAKFPGISKKRADFILFKKVVNLMYNKEHFTVEGFQKILNLKASLNLGAPTSLNEFFPNIIPVSRPKVENIGIR